MLTAFTKSSFTRNVLAVEGGTRHAKTAEPIRGTESSKAETHVSLRARGGFRTLCSVPALSEQSESAVISINQEPVAVSGIVKTLARQTYSCNQGNGYSRRVGALIRARAEREWPSWKQSDQNGSRGFKPRFLSKAKRPTDGALSSREQRLKHARQGCSVFARSLPQKLYPVQKDNGTHSPSFPHLNPNPPRSGACDLQCRGSFSCKHQI